MTAPALATRDFDGLVIPRPGTFNIDPTHTTVGFVARHLMVSKARGSFTDVAGTIVIAENPLESRVDVTIGAASLTTGVADRDAHLRGPDFLDVERFPSLTFRSQRLVETDGSDFKIIGELTIRDTTRQVTLDVEFEGVAQSPWGQEVIGFTVTTEIDREDYGMTWNQALETGGVLVSKKVKIEIGAEAVRQAE